MSQANVEDLDVFRSLKTALIKFKQSAETAVLNGDAQVLRTRMWLENEQTTYWQTQLRKRTEAVQRAQEAVRMKKIFKDSTGRTQSAFQEEKILRAAMAALEQAEQRLAATKKAIPKLQKEYEAYRGAVQGLGNVLAAELPKALAMLQNVALSMEEYIAVEASSTAGGEASPLPSPVETPMSRGGETAEQAQPEAAPTAQPAPEVKKDVAG